MPREPHRHRRHRGLKLVGLLLLTETIAMRLRGFRTFGAHVVVRCRQGHVFTTIWIPGASMKSLRLLWWRYQYCPVGKHWSLVTPVKESTLTPSQLEAARQHPDIRLP